MFGYNVNSLEHYEARIADFIKNNIEANKNFSEEEKAKRTAGVISLYANPFSGLKYDNETGKLSVADGFTADIDGFIHKVV